MLTTELPGRTCGYLVAEIRPQVNGLIQKRLFTEGSDVKAEQVLYQIDPAPYQAALDNAAANLLAARKAADRARAALDASIAGLKRHQAILKLAKTNLQRYENLVKTKAASAMERDQAATDVEVAEAGLRAAEAQVESDRQAVEAAEAAIKQAEAAVADGPDQSGLHQDHRPHFRPHRPVQRDRRRHRHGLSAGAPGHHPAIRPDLRGCAAIHRGTESIETQPGGRPPQGERDRQGQDRPGGRHRVSAGRIAQVPRRDGGPDDRVGHLADRRSQSRRHAPARHVRPGGRSTKASTSRRSSFRSRPSRAIPRAIRSP